MVIATNLTNSTTDRPLPTDADLRIIATTTTLPLDTQLRNYSKYWVELLLTELELPNERLDLIISGGTSNIIDEIYELENYQNRPHFELQLEGLYYTITHGRNNPLPHKCPNQVDRLVDYIKSIYRS